MSNVVKTIIIFIIALAITNAIWWYFKPAKEQPEEVAKEVEKEVDDMTDEEKEKAIEEAMDDAEKPEMTEEEQAAVDVEVEEILAKEEPAVIELTAAFTGVAHPTTGTTKVIEDGGKRILVLSDDFTSDPGPNLHVYISGTANPTTSAAIHEVGDADLGTLQDTNGTQMYTIPDSVDFDIKSVIIYCVPFKVIFGTATF